MDPIFAIAAPVAVLASLGMVTRRNPVYSAVSLLVAFLAMAILFLTLSATFLAAIHLLVYTGAILVLFVFVIMLLNLRDEEHADEYPIQIRAAVGVLCTALFGLLANTIYREPKLHVAIATPSETYGSVEEVGKLLFTKYGLPFELVSLLIIVAMFGAMVLAKKRVAGEGAA